MCGTCGCGEDNQITYSKPGDTMHHHRHSHIHKHADGTEHEHEHEHTGGHAHQHTHQHDDGHEHSHGHSHTGEHAHTHSHELKLEIDVLSVNNKLAERNRGYFEALNIKAFNLVSSPGSGKTSLLEKTISDLKGKSDLYIIEGDQQTSNDADRINKAGAPVIQINTGNGCHLDAHMINHATKELKPKQDSILFIENVGNLVCPSLFDLGEKKRVVIISVTEGEDKPIKYPTMFASSHLCIINKTDLLPYVDFNVEKAKAYAKKVNHHLEFIELSVKTGEGMDKWYSWLNNQ